MRASSVNIIQGESTRTITLLPGETVAVLNPGDSIVSIESIVKFMQEISTRQKEMNDLLQANNVRIASNTTQLIEQNDLLQANNVRIALNTNPKFATKTPDFP